jgi:Limonene-1,2-epoxide hydrolase catalytic domain
VLRTLPTSPATLPYLRGRRVLRGSGVMPAQTAKSRSPGGRPLSPDMWAILSLAALYQTIRDRSENCRNDIQASAGPLKRDNQFVRGHVAKTQALRAFLQLLRFEPGRFPGARREAAYLALMGTFEVTGGKISARRDYFDMNQFTSRMG